MIVCVAKTEMGGRSKVEGAKVKTEGVSEVAKVKTEDMSEVAKVERTYNKQSKEG